MLLKIATIMLLIGIAGVFSELYLVEYDEAFVQQVNLPLSSPVLANFKTKYDGRYNVIIALKRSDELVNARQKTRAGDAYQSSRDLGRYVLEEIKVSEAVNPISNFKEKFSIFGPAPFLLHTKHTWDPHASYILATFNGKADNQQSISMVQNNNNILVNKINIPALIMIRLSEVENKIRIGYLIIFIGISSLFFIFSLLVHLALKIKKYKNKNKNN